MDEHYPKLLLGDCTKRLRHIRDNTVDLIVTSPPYADRRNSTYGGIPPAKYVDDQIGWDKLVKFNSASR